MGDSIPLGFSAMHAILRHVSADLHPIRIAIFHFSRWRLRMSPLGLGCVKTFVLD